MPGSNPDAAWRSFLDPFARSIGCVDTGFRAAWRRVTEDLYQVVSPDHRPAQLSRSSGPDAVLRFGLNLSPVQTDDGGWRMTTKRYSYSFSVGSDVVRWEWHPQSRKSKADWPHFHPVADAGRGPFGNKHLPSGRIALEDILLWSIRQLGVLPAFPTAESRLKEIRENHARFRSWA